MKNKTSAKWTLKLSALAIKDLNKLDRKIKALILRYLYTRIEAGKDPRRFGKALSGNLKDFWSYRVQDYRIICEIHDHCLTIAVVKVGHRSTVYKNVHFLKFPA